ncbi:MAG: hypothetical protein WAV28_07045 [Sedimentisphaerales bacterium]
MAKRKIKKKKAVKQTAEPPKTETKQPPKITPHPTAGPKITEFEEMLDAQLAGDELRRGPGRPPKQPPPEEPEVLSAEIVVGIIKLPFELWAISQGVEQLALTNKEAAQMAVPVKQLVDFYLPQIPPIAYAWIALTINGFWIFRTRLLLIQAIKASSRAQVDDKGHGGPRPPAQPQGGNIKFPSKIETEKV